MLGWKSDKAGNHIPPKQKKTVHGVQSSVESKGIIQHKFLKKNDFVEVNLNNVNETEATEITLGALSDGDFYRRIINPNAENIAKHMLRNDFEKNHLLTKRSFIDRIGKEAIMYYEKEFGSADSPMQINTDTKRMIGKNIAEKILDLARDLVRIRHPDPKDKFLIEKKFGEREEYLESKNNVARAMENF